MGPGRCRVRSFQFRLITLVVAQFAVGYVLLGNIGSGDCVGRSEATIVFSSARGLCVDEESHVWDYGVPWKFITITNHTKGVFLGTTYEIEWFVLLLDSIFWAAFVLGLACACEWCVRRRIFDLHMS